MSPGCRFFCRAIISFLKTVNLLTPPPLENLNGCVFSYKYAAVKIYIFLKAVPLTFENKLSNVSFDLSDCVADCVPVLAVSAVVAGRQESCVYEALVPPLEEGDFEKTLTPIVQEYFEHGDTNEVAVSGPRRKPQHTDTHTRLYRSDTQKHTVPTTS